MLQFINGRTLSNEFYLEVIRPLLANTPHDACLIGEGSDVLGYDQPISIDHDWGPRVTLFVADEKEAILIRDKIILNLSDSFKDGLVLHSKRLIPTKTLKKTLLRLYPAIALRSK